MRFLRTSMFAAFCVTVLSACGGSPPAESPAAPAEPPAADEPAGTAEPTAQADEQTCGGCPDCNKKGAEKKGNGEGCQCGHCDKQTRIMELCVALMADADVSVVNPTDSTALIFTANDMGKIADVQARVQEFADMHKQPDKEGGKEHVWMKLPDAAVTVTASSTASGAQILLVPQDLEKLPALRKLIEAQAKQMSEPNCGMAKMAPSPPPPN